MCVCTSFMQFFHIFFFFRAYFMNLASTKRFSCSNLTRNLHTAKSWALKRATFPAILEICGSSFASNFFCIILWRKNLKAVSISGAPLRFGLLGWATSAWAKTLLRPWVEVHVSGSSRRIITGGSGSRAHYHKPSHVSVASADMLTWMLLPGSPRGVPPWVWDRDSENGSNCRPWNSLLYTLCCWYSAPYQCYIILRWRRDGDNSHAAYSTITL
jgi:hypothetical protein